MSLQLRVVAGITAIVGAVIMTIGCFVPYLHQGDTDVKVFVTSAPYAALFFAAEPAFVIISAVVLGVLLIIRPPFRLTPGFLLGTGATSMLYFIGDIGFYARAGFFGH